jgi:hypothetical protein
MRLWGWAAVWAWVEWVASDFDPWVRFGAFWRWPIFTHFCRQDSLPKESNVWVLLEGFAYPWALHGEEFGLDSGHS